MAELKKRIQRVLDAKNFPEKKCVTFSYDYLITKFWKLLRETKHFIQNNLAV